MAKNYRRGRRTQSSGRQVLLASLLLFGAAVIFGGFGYLYWKSTSKAQLDAKTLCPESGPTGQLAILIDMTDPVSVTQLRFARSALDNKIETAALGTLITIGVVNPEDTAREQAFLSVCKPPSKAQADQLIENPTMIQRRYEEVFQKPLDEMLTRLLTVSQADSSPIMEDLQAMLSRIGGFTSVRGSKELVILSNLVQHSPILSFYKGQGWTDFKAGGGVGQLAGNLEGVEITLLKFPAEARFEEVLGDFWVRYFETQGAPRVFRRKMGDF